MKYIERWSLMHSTVKENVMEHSAGVAMIAHALGVINNVVFSGGVSPDRCAAIAVFHEASEVITGDLPAHIKISKKSPKSSCLPLFPKRSGKATDLWYCPGKGLNTFW